MYAKTYAHVCLYTWKTGATELVCKTKHVHTFIQSQGLTHIWRTQFKGTIWIVYLTIEDEVFVL